MYAFLKPVNSLIVIKYSTIINFIKCFFTDNIVFIHPYYNKTTVISEESQIKKVKIQQNKLVA